jgi:signal transduction histidine kinase
VVALELARRQLGDITGAAVELLDEALAHAQRATDELRETAHGIHPAILARGGLGPALTTLARRSPVPVELEVSTETRLPAPVEVAAYYVVSEALTNVAKHSHASAAHVAVTADADRLELLIRDDGQGGADPRRGSGLIGLTDRVEVLGGKLHTTSVQGTGTTLHVTLPLDPAAGDDHGTH